MRTTGRHCLSPWWGVQWLETPGDQPNFRATATATAKRSDGKRNHTTVAATIRGRARARARAKWTTRKDARTLGAGGQEVSEQEDRWKSGRECVSCAFFAFLIRGNLARHVCGRVPLCGASVASGECEAAGELIKPIAVRLPNDNNNVPIITVTVSSFSLVQLKFPVLSRALLGSIARTRFTDHSRDTTAHEQGPQHTERTHDSQRGLVSVLVAQGAPPRRCHRSVSRSSSAQRTSENDPL